MITLEEGSPGNITCSVSGVPIPTVSWEFNNQTMPFRQTITHVDVSTTDKGDVIPGKIISTLHLVEPVYPDQQGMYTCTGMNGFGSMAAIAITSSFVKVEGKLVAFLLQLNVGYHSVSHLLLPIGKHYRYDIIYFVWHMCLRKKIEIFCIEL